MCVSGANKSKESEPTKKEADEAALSEPTPLPGEKRVEQPIILLNSTVMATLHIIAVYGLFRLHEYSIYTYLYSKLNHVMILILIIVDHYTVNLFE